MKLINKNFGLLVALVLTAACSTTTIETKSSAQAVHLPDGSVVILNQNSSLEYNTKFEARQVALDGEAFFQVQKEEVPFVVTTGNGQITVLGTSFNVKDSKDGLEVEVETGAVELKAKEQVARLKKGQKALVNDAKGVFKKGKAEFKHHIWTDDFKKDLKAVGKEVKESGKKVGKEFQKLGRKIKKELKDK